ncbi:hypothetical protein MF573_00305 [Klebsiella pneumoniae]|nr:hypothetical protein MF573_00305 [Klebsiella pneumoniae]
MSGCIPRWMNRVLREKLARHPSFTVVSDQIKARAGETLLETAISLQKAGLHTPAQQAIYLAPFLLLESKNLAFSMVDLLTDGNGSRLLQKEPVLLNWEGIETTMQADKTSVHLPAWMWQ